jgi:hypothetical protein
MAEEDSTIDVVVEKGDDEAELCVVAVFSFLFAVCISAVTVSIAYFFILEDALMRRFAEEGLELEAKVVDTSFVRHHATEGAEYAATVDYRYLNGDDHDGYYATIIRKQIKCLESDIHRPLDSTPSNRVYIEVNAELQGFPSFDGCSVVVFEEPPQRYIPVLVLPAHPNSAIPSGYVQRTVQPEKRRPTAMLVLFLTAVTLFCIDLGLTNALQLSRNSELLLLLQGRWGAIFGVSVMVTMTLLGVELLLLHTSCCRELFRDAVHQDYLVGGAVETKMDDETLASVATNSWKTPMMSPLRSPLSPAHSSSSTL